MLREEKEELGSFIAKFTENIERNADVYVGNGKTPIWCIELPKNDGIYRKDFKATNEISEIDFIEVDKLIALADKTVESSQPQIIENIHGKTIIVSTFLLATVRELHAKNCI